MSSLRAIIDIANIYNSFLFYRGGNVLDTNIKLRQEVYRNDALKIIDWLDDSEVTKYLNEKDGISKSVSNVIESVNMPILTHLFNQNGSFFIILDNNDPIGFLRLVHKGSKAEMVLAIGDREKWGKGLGPTAIKEGLKTAFFNWRVDEVIAKINFKNHRSKKAFTKVGFEEDIKLQREMQYSMSWKNFIALAA